MTVKTKRRSLRCGGRPKADFGSIFTSYIAPGLTAVGSIVDSAVSKHQANKTTANAGNDNVRNDNASSDNNTSNDATTEKSTYARPGFTPVAGASPQDLPAGMARTYMPEGSPLKDHMPNSNIVIPSDPTKMRLGGRHKAWIGAAIGAATSIASSIFGNSAKKKQERLQKSMQDWQDTTQEASAMTASLNNSSDYQEDYLRQFRAAARLGKTLGAKGIYITDGGDATKVDNNTYLLQGGSHEDINETGQTGIGINVGGNEVEAEGGEVAQKKGNSLRIFSAQPILGGMSPAQAILRGYNKDDVFARQQAFKKRNGLNDDGSKAKYGANYPNPLVQLVSTLYNQTLGKFDDKNPYLQTGIAPTPSRALNLKQVRSGLITKNMLPTNRVYRITNMREVQDAKHIGQYRKLPDNITLPTKIVKSKSGRSFSFGKAGGNSHGGKAASMGEPWSGTTSAGVGDSRYVISTPARGTTWQVGHHGRYSEPLPADAIKKGSGIWKKFDANGNTGISTKRMMVYKDLGNGMYLRLSKNKYRLGGGLTSKDKGSSKHPYPSVPYNDFAGGGRSYPIPTKADAVDALRLAGLHGRSDVKAKVYDKYPELRHKARVGTWVKPTYNTSKYRGTDRARKQIAKWEGADFAGQNKQFHGDAIGAKERELRQFMGKAYNYLNDNQRDALLSYYYNLVPKTFRGQMTKYRDALINAQTEQEYNDSLNGMRESINVGANRKGMSGLRNRRAIERNWFGYGYTNPVQQKVNQITTQVPDATQVAKPIVPQVIVQQPIEVNPQDGYVPSSTSQGFDIPQGRMYDYIKQNAMKRQLRCGGRVSRPVKGMRPKAELGWLGYPYELPRDWDFSNIQLGNFKPSNLSTNYPYGRGQNNIARQLESTDNYRVFTAYRNQLPESHPYVQALTKATGHSWNDIKANNYNLRFDGLNGYNHYTPPEKQNPYGIWGEPIKQDTWQKDNSIDVKVPYAPQDGIVSKPVVSSPAKQVNQTPAYQIKENKLGMSPSTGDWIGLGVDTLAGLAGGILSYNAAKNMYIPGRAPIIMASKLPTNYNVAPQVEEVKRMRDNVTRDTYNNTSSSVAALNRANSVNLNALSELSKLWATKENEENKMLTQDALNQQQVAETNARNEMARESEIAQYKNAQNQGKYDSINASLTGLAQAYNNFYTNATKRYEDEVAMRTYLAGAENATPYRMLSMGVPMSQDALIGIYNQIGSINDPGARPERKDYDSNASWSRAVDKWERDNTLYRQRGEYRNMVANRLNRKSRLRLGIR